LKDDSTILALTPLITALQFVESLSDEEGFKYGSHLISILKILHTNGIYHRDIRPHNILLQGKEESKKLCLIDYSESDYLGNNITHNTLFGQKQYVSNSILLSVEKKRKVYFYNF